MSYNGVVVLGTSGLLASIQQATEAGKSTELKILRDQKTLTVTAQPGPLGVETSDHLHGKTPGKGGG